MASSVVGGSAGQGLSSPCCACVGSRQAWSVAYWSPWPSMLGDCKELVADVNDVWLAPWALLAHVQAVESRPRSMKWSACNKGKSGLDYQLRMVVEQRTYRRKVQERLS